MHKTYSNKKSYDSHICCFLLSFLKGSKTYTRYLSVDDEEIKSIGVFSEVFRRRYSHFSLKVVFK